MIGLIILFTRPELSRIELNSGLEVITKTMKHSNELEILNSLQTHGYTVNNRRTAKAGEYYKAVLACPSGAQYEDLAIRHPEPGCKWKHVKVSKPLPDDVPKTLPQDYYTPNLKNSVYSQYFQRKLPYRPIKNDVNITPRIFSESRLPNYLRNNRRKEYFRWNRR